MRSPIWPQKLINFLKRPMRKREIHKTLQDSKRPKGLRLFDFFPNKRGVCGKNIYFKWQQKSLGEFKTCATIHPWTKICDKEDFFLHHFFQQICQLWHPFDLKFNTRQGCNPRQISPGFCLLVSHLLP